ncbi:hypothetical protein [Spiroplasma endosymbiont of Agriotes lineatus]|uniref:hypothetical protein n=1 Tax=Spiroplasma endosymbiont of Agriotes lineatus TaxID=3077930 RepID=UPI0030CF2C43
MKKLLGIIGKITIAGGGWNDRDCWQCPKKNRTIFYETRKMNNKSCPYLVEANNDIIVKYDYYYGRTGDDS